MSKSQAASNHLLALGLSQVHQRTTFPFPVLCRPVIAENVVVQSQTPLGLHRVTYLPANAAVLDPPQQSPGPPACTQ